MEMSVFNKKAEMNSLQIAELVGKRHDSVKRTIQFLADNGVIVRPHGVDEQSTDALGRTRFTKVFVFSGEQGKRDSIIVVAQLSPEFTAALVDRWMELEAQLQFQAPTTLHEALFLAAENAKQAHLLQQQVTAQTVQITEQRERIDALEGLFSEGMTPSDFCKALNGVNVMQVNACLAEKHWLYHAGEYRVTSYARDKYLAEEARHVKAKNATFYKPVLLKKGAVKLFDLYQRGELPMKKDWDGSTVHKKVGIKAVSGCINQPSLFQ